MHSGYYEYPVYIYSRQFLGTDIALKSFLDNPELYNVVDHSNINEIISGLFLNKSISIRREVMNL